jgi:predicted lipoprotein with Yx(FWY)xxD motif
MSKTVTARLSGRAKPGLVKTSAGVGVAMVTALLAAACSSGSSSSAPSAAQPTSGSGAPSSATVVTTASASGATFLTDGSGKALYLWVKDPSGSSACAGACASAWPPLTSSGSMTASGGAKSSDLGTITRSDGTKQVTYNGHPLYYFAGDSGSGTATGQSLDQFGAKWWLVSPAGASVTASVGSFKPGSAGSGSGGSGSIPSAPVPTSSSASAGGGWS